MPARAPQVRNVAFFLLIAVFAVLVALISPGGRSVGIHGGFLVALALGFGVLGAVVALLTLRLPEGLTIKAFFLLTGTSAAGIVLCAILHNAVYGFLAWYSPGFWETHGVDEGFFLVLAVVVCPALFLIGAIGSLALLIRGRLTRRTLV